jgi:hypothetical protein
MKRAKSLSLLALLAMTVVGGFTVASAPKAEAYYGYRQYYSSWRYYPSRTYYYSSYYYKPYDSYSGYKHHYCVYYPSQPRYVYYYNPYRQVYWGRYDVESKGYSLLADKDRKQKLEDIPESAFPKPGKMPAIPEGEDSVAMEPPPSELPKGEPSNQ